MSEKPILYSYFRSSCTWRVRIVLAWKGVEYTTKPVNLIKDGGEQLKEEYKSLNPMGQVPALVIDGKTMNQSISIMEFLEDKYPEPPLLPKDIHQRQKVREICEIIGSGIQPIQNLSVLQKIGEEKMQWGHYWIEKGFKALETVLKTTAGKYCCGDDVTMADCCLVPQIYNANRFKVDMTEFPTITRISESLNQLDSFQIAHPSKQPDCPPELK